MYVLCSLQQHAEHIIAIELSFSVGRDPINCNKIDMIESILPKIVNTVTCTEGKGERVL